MKPRYLGLIPLLLAFLGTACSTVRLPLCPKVAEVSYATKAEGAGKLVNKFVAEEATSLGLKIKVVSSCAAEFYGAPGQLAKLKQKYPDLLFSYNPAGSF